MLLSACAHASVYVRVECFFFWRAYVCAPLSVNVDLARKYYKAAWTSAIRHGRDQGGGAVARPQEVSKCSSSACSTAVIEASVVVVCASAKTRRPEIRPDPESHVTARGGRGQARAACYHGLHGRKGVSPRSRRSGKNTSLCELQKSSTPRFWITFYLYVKAHGKSTYSLFPAYCLVCIEVTSSPQRYTTQFRNLWQTHRWCVFPGGAVRRRRGGDVGCAACARRPSSLITLATLMTITMDYRRRRSASAANASLSDSRLRFFALSRFLLRSLRSIRAWRSIYRTERLGFRNEPVREPLESGLDSGPKRSGDTDSIRTPGPFKSRAARGIWTGLLSGLIVRIKKDWLVKDLALIPICVPRFPQVRVNWNRN